MDPTAAGLAAFLVIVALSLACGGRPAPKSSTAPEGTGDG
jgi:polyhydroxybutyrate depolymerase